MARHRRDKACLAPGPLVNSEMIHDLKSSEVCYLFFFFCAGMHVSDPLAANPSRCRVFKCCVTSTFETKGSQAGANLNVNQTRQPGDTLILR
jgi:hypothetical protein